MINLVLYGTIGCHLCDEALGIVLPFEESFPLLLLQIDIAEDENLLDQYGLLIPVLLNIDNKKTLAWPFDSHQVASFLKEGCK